MFSSAELPASPSPSPDSAGLADPRGNLALTYLAVADRYRPRWVVWENVPGVLSSGRGRAFGAFLGGLAELGYGFAYRVLDAQYFGLAQRRKRVFVVGHLGDWRRAAAVLFERESLSGHPAPRREAGKTAPTVPSRRSAGGGLGTDFDCDGGLIPSTGDISHCLNAGGMGRIDYESETLITHAAAVAPCLTSNYGKQPDSSDTGLGPMLIAHALRADGFDASEDGTGRGTPLVPIGGSFDDGGNRAGRLSFMGCATRDRRSSGFPIAFSAKDYGADAGDLAPTLRAGGFTGSHANGGVIPAIAFDARQSDVIQYGDKTGLLDTDGHTMAIAFRSDAGRSGEARNPSPDAEGRMRLRDAGFNVYEEVAPTLDASSPHGFGRGMQVRRLTPRECERLQGFPDDYTLIPYRGKPAADGPRYKALGNSMAVPVMAWIGARMQRVDDARGDQR
jgi:DNA (cytosine-5)-methyltransferase 1